MFRQLGEEVNAECDTFVDINNKIICDVNAIEKALKEDSVTFRPYNNDHIRKVHLDKVPHAILYGDLGSSSFAQFHKKLSGLSDQNKVQYVFRHFSKVSKGYFFTCLTVVLIVNQ